jgi:hypothetical protein
MPSACSMVEIGTGTAPIRMAARYTTTNSGESAMTMTTRWLGLQAEAAQAAGGVRDAVGEFGVAESPATPVSARRSPRPARMCRSSR